MSYKAFISYSHATDGKLAPAVHSALHKFAKPWYRLRTLRVFRDKTSLSVNPGLWPSIEKALSESEYFLLMASLEAARSSWVQKEIDHWLNRNSSDKLLIILTEGEICWDNGMDDFDWNKTTALPQNLRGVFNQELRWLDLRWARTEEHLSLKHPKFREGIAELSATLHNKSLDEITGEDVRQHRKTRRFVWSGVMALLIFALAAAVFAYIARQQRNEAIQQSRISLSRQLAAHSMMLLDDQLDLALLLSLEAHMAASTVEAQTLLLKGLEQRQKITKTLHGQTGSVTSLCFSPDGRKLASGSSDGVIVLWDVEGGQQIGDPLRGHKGGWTSWVTVDFSPDGKILASGGGADDSVILWDARSGHPVGGFWVGDQFSVTSYSYSPDGSRFALGTSEGTIILWDIESGKPIGDPLRKHESPVYCVDFSPDGRKLASGSEDGMVILWDVESEYPIGSPLGMHEHPVASVTFSSDSKQLASGSGFRVGRRYGAVILWDVESREPIDTLRGPVGWGFSVSFSPNCGKLASGCIDGTIILWDVERGQQIGDPLRGHRSTVQSVTFSPDGTELASGHDDGTVILWDIESGQPLADSWRGHTGQVRSVAFSPDGKKLASCGADSTIILWDVESEEGGEPFGYYLRGHKNL